LSTKKTKGMKGNSNAWAISDRSGFRVRMRDCIIEPGTGYLLAKWESDGRYNFVDHPQAHINEYVTFGDPFPVADARPDINWASTSSTLLTDQNGNALMQGYVSFDLLNTSLIPDYVPWPGSGDGDSE
jgi:hypothetical protein